MRLYDKRLQLECILLVVCFIGAARIRVRVTRYACARSDISKVVHHIIQCMFCMFCEWNCPTEINIPLFLISRELVIIGLTKITNELKKHKPSCMRSLSHSRKCVIPAVIADPNNCLRFLVEKAPVIPFSASWKSVEIYTPSAGSLQPDVNYSVTGAFCLSCNHYFLPAVTGAYFKRRWFIEFIVIIIDNFGMASRFLLSNSRIKLFKFILML